MFKSAQLGEIMETSCFQCEARYRITDEQLKLAMGKVRCGECGVVFNALSTLKTYADNDNSPATPYHPELESHSPPISQPVSNELSLHEAMYGEGRGSFTLFSPLL